MTPDRIQNSIYIAERDECPWVRPKDFRGIELPRPVVLVNGAYDLLHSGHMKVLFRARRKAGIGTVIVALDSDIRCGRKLGRPIQSFIERATTLSYMPIDYIVEIDSDADMLEVIRGSKVDLRVQGSDYRGKPTKYPWVPRSFVAGVGKTGLRMGMSTTKLIERICSKNK